MKDQFANGIQIEGLAEEVIGILQAVKDALDGVAVKFPSEGIQVKEVAENVNEIKELSTAKVEFNSKIEELVSVDVEQSDKVVVQARSESEVLIKEMERSESMIAAQSFVQLAASHKRFEELVEAMKIVEGLAVQGKAKLEELDKLARERKLQDAVKALIDKVASWISVTQSLETTSKQWKGCKTKSKVALERALKKLEETLESLPDEISGASKLVKQGIGNAGLEVSSWQEIIESPIVGKLGEFSLSLSTGDGVETAAKEFEDELRTTIATLKAAVATPIVIPRVTQLVREKLNELHKVVAAQVLNYY